MNRTASRTAIRDNQTYTCENAQPIGPGQLQTLVSPGPTVATIGAGIATFAEASLTLAGVSTPLFLTVNNDGSMSQVNAVTGAITAVAGAGTVTTKARMTHWQDTRMLIVDPTKGYSTWDGATYTLIDATKLARDVAVFEGRAWLLTGSRAITFTAPLTYNDFTLVNAAGSVIVTDSVFVGPVTRLLSALELLWIVGPAAVNAISNVKVSGTTTLVTTFTDTNIVANVGSIFPSSIASFFRTFLMLTPYGVYAIVGATPQKLSEDLDGLFPDLHLDPATHLDCPAAVFSLNNVFIWAVLVHYIDPVRGHRPILLCFSRGAWFMADQGTVTWMASVVIDGQPILFGTDGSRLFRLFAGTTGPFTISTKLWDFGAFTIAKQMLKAAYEAYTRGTTIVCDAYGDTELGSTLIPALIAPQPTISFTGAGGAPLTFVGAGPITWTLTGGRILTAHGLTDVNGQYLGLTLKGTSQPWTLDALAMELEPQGPWTFRP